MGSRLAALLLLAAGQAACDEESRPLRVRALLVDGAPAIEVIGSFALPDGSEVLLSLELDGHPAPGAWRSLRVENGGIREVYDFRGPTVLPGVYAVRARAAGGVEATAPIRVGTPEEEVEARTAFDRWLERLEGEAGVLASAPAGLADRARRVAALRAEVQRAVEPGRYVAIYREARVRDLLVRSTLLALAQGEPGGPGR